VGGGAEEEGENGSGDINGPKGLLGEEMRQRKTDGGREKLTWGKGKEGWGTARVIRFSREKGEPPAGGSDAVGALKHDQSQ